MLSEGAGPPSGSAPGSVSASHRASAPTSVRAHVVTCSDSREPASDESGRLTRELLTGAGHEVVGYQLVREDPELIRAALVTGLESGAKVLLLNGGTGLSARDGTADVVKALLEREIPGFGELFRALSYQQVGSAAMLSRATAGVYRGAAVFVMPGSPAAVELALTKLILPELGHLVRELSR